MIHQTWNDKTQRWEPQTNGDKIRTMNDEDLALTRVVRLRAGFVMAYPVGTFTSFKKAYDAELAWLRQEAT